MNPSATVMLLAKYLNTTLVKVQFEGKFANGDYVD